MGETCNIRNIRNGKAMGDKWVGRWRVTYLKNKDGQEIPYWEDGLWTKTGWGESSGQWEQVLWC